MTKQYPTVSAKYQKTVEKARKKLRGLIAEKHCAPLMLRVAYDLSPFLFLTHSLSFNGEDLLLVLTVYDVIGGVQVSLSHGANNGLDINALVVGNPSSNGWLMVQCSSSEMGSSSDPINMSTANTRLSKSKRRQELGDGKAPLEASEIAIEN
ncbi:hypothetical protein SO802_034420 [Lithocarpus litseifolius]|uniref:Uncharacterized protein n=1 Tax=Lithocarpus litseifolius TaxID=425828 RepID=A0AAW2BJ44_9ROSI